MPLFKRKIGLDDFLHELVKYGFMVFDDHLDLMLIACDTEHCLTADDKRRLLELTGALVAASVLVGKHVHYDDKMPHDEFSDRLGRAYLDYLINHLHLGPDDVRRRAEQFLAILQRRNYLYEHPKEPSYWEHLKDPEAPSSPDEVTYLVLCYAFSDVYSEERDKNIAAFKLAKLFVTNDMTGEFLKRFRVVFE